MSRRAVAAAAALFLFACPTRAAAAGETEAAAEALYVEGTKLMSEKRFAEACPKLEESMRLDPSIGTGLYLADCFEKTARPASAWAVFRDAQDLASRQRDARADVAKRRADRLEPTLPKIAIVVAKDADVDGLEVQRDTATVGRAQWQTPVPVDPGAHMVRARAPHKKPWEMRVEIAPGPGTSTVTVPPLVDAPEEPTTPAVVAPTPPPPAPETPPPRTREDAGGTQRIAGLAVAGAGAVTTVIGLVVGLNSKSIYDASNADSHCIDDHCDAYGTMRRENAFSAARVATGLVIAGGLATAGGIAVFLTAPRTKVPVSVAPSASAGGGGLVLGGRF